MRSHLKMLIVIVMVALFAGPVSAIAREPVNGCIMIPEVLKGKRAGEATQTPVYEPESCIAMKPRPLSDSADFT